MNRSASAIALTICSFVSISAAEVTLPSVFSSSMVLQRDRQVPVWGKADPGESVTVSFAGQQKSVEADQSGRWMVQLDPIRESFEPRSMTVRGKNQIKLDDVLVGDVWLCSGQSNMEWSIAQSNDAEQEMQSSAAWTTIRLFNVSPNKRRADEPQFDVVETKWEVAGPETVKNFSAVGYFFGRQLRQHLDVPIGLINSSWGGMPAEAFTPVETLKKHEEFAPILSRYDDALKVWPQKKVEYEKRVADWEAAAKLAKEKNEPPPPNRPWMPPLGPESPAAPGVLWNGMIAPLRPYAIRGVIWYQGETNAPRAEQYRTLLPAMIQSWREAWRVGGSTSSPHGDSTASPTKDFSFLVVQLANWKAPASQPSQPSDWAELREAQSLAARTLPKVDYIVITDIGDTKDIHPRNKQEVGRRLALAARSTAYGEGNVESHGPKFKDVKFDGNRAIVSFDAPVRLRGDKAMGFLIAGADKTWHWADATLDRGKVMVSSDNVKSPTAVRYNWADNPVGNLFGESGLPVEPFRSDDWPLTTAGAR